MHTSFSVKSSSALNGTGGVLAYIMTLEPIGFLVVSADTDLSPIIAYSFKSNYYPDNEPRNILFNMLKKDLELRKQAVGKGLIDVQANNDLWNRYISKETAYFSRLRIQKWPDRPTVRTDGWVATTWNQLEPYNSSCPLDPTTGRRSFLSSAAISLAQTIHYFRYLGNAGFGTADGYTTLNGVNIDGDNQTADFPSFSVINTRLKSIDQKLKSNTSLNNSDISTLCFTSGIAVNTHFTSIGTVTWTWDIAHAVRNKFSYRQTRSYYADSDSFYVHIQNNAKQKYPVILLLQANYDYAIICDGYNTAGEYHLNFGWAKDDKDNYTLAWYNLPTYKSSEFNILSQAITNIGRGIEALTTTSEEVVRIELGEEDLRLNIFKMDESEEATTKRTIENVVDEALAGVLEGDNLPTIGSTSRFEIYDEPPVPFKQVPPRYPKMLRRSGIQGEVVLRVEVLVTGKVGEVEVLKSLMPGEGGFDEAAIEAVKKWEFTPAKSSGKPVSCWVVFPMNFSLN
jgi:TonB family protein